MPSHWIKNKNMQIPIKSPSDTKPHYTGPDLTLGGPSSDGTFSWGMGLDWGWVCGSVRAGADGKNDGDDEEDAG